HLHLPFRLMLRRERGRKIGESGECTSMRDSVGRFQHVNLDHRKTHALSFVIIECRRLFRLAKLFWGLFRILRAGSGRRSLRLLDFFIRVRGLFGLIFAQANALPYSPTALACYWTMELARMGLSLNIRARRLAKISGASNQELASRSSIRHGGEAKAQ